MKRTKEQIEKIKELKEKGENMRDISKKLNIPESTVHYYCDEKYKIKEIERTKKRFKEVGDTRDKEKYRKYQREYHSRRYNEDPEFREKVKERNRNNQRK